MTTGSVLKYLLEGCLNIRVLCYSLYEDQVGNLPHVQDVHLLLRQEHLVTDAYVQQLLLLNPMPALVAFYFEKCVLTEEVKLLLQSFRSYGQQKQKIDGILQNMDFRLSSSSSIDSQVFASLASSLSEQC